MFIKNIEETDKWMVWPLQEGEKSKLTLVDVVHPEKDEISIGFSAARFELEPGARSVNYKLLKSTEVWIVIQGKACIEINGSKKEIRQNQLVYIQPNSERTITNTGDVNLIILSISDPPFYPHEEEILEPADVEVIPARNTLSM